MDVYSDFFFVEAGGEDSEINPGAESEALERRKRGRRERTHH